jgi:hypothetical protein
MAASESRCDAWAMTTTQSADALVAAALTDAAAVLAPRDGMAGEEPLRSALVDALRRRFDGVVDTERSIAIPEFQGVGPVDVLLRADSASAPWGLIECKWSADLRRDKIFEGAWDAVKLALATREPGVQGWLVTGAPLSSWAASETADLFADGILSSKELWERPLRSPGSNGGLTVGEDCEAGGLGNMFTHAHAELVISAVAAARATDSWEIRATRVVGQGELVRFADAPEFPRSVNQHWLAKHVPDMDADTFERLLLRLRAKRWTDAEVAQRVMPLRAAHRAATGKPGQTAE